MYILYTNKLIYTYSLINKVLGVTPSITTLLSWIVTYTNFMQLYWYQYTQTWKNKEQYIYIVQLFQLYLRFKCYESNTSNSKVMFNNVQIITTVKDSIVCITNTLLKMVLIHYGKYYQYYLTLKSTTMVIPINITNTQRTYCVNGYVHCVYLDHNGRL